MSTLGSKEKFSIACPYCTRTVPADAKECPGCGTSYGSETIRLIRNVTEGPVPGSINERRQYDRVPKKFKIAYSSAQALVSSYLFDIGLGGVFLKTDHPLERGARINLKILLPDGGEELEVSGEVVWTRSEEMVASKEKAPPGMGIKFLNLSPEGRKRINSVLKQAKSK
ncbi:MAG: TIGR02266 family protein [Pseudomonadota bacterium]